MRRSIEERLLSKTKVDDNGCWIWTGCLDTTGYGKLATEGGKWDRAHRIAYRLFVGKIPDGYDVHHRCEVRRCLNPAHLHAVTRKDHLAIHPPTGVAASNGRKTHCVHGHPLSGTNVRVTKQGWRICRACKRQAVATAWRKQHDTLLFRDSD